MMRGAEHPPVQVAVAVPADFDSIAAVTMAAYDEYRQPLGPDVWGRMHDNLRAVAGLAAESVLLVARVGGEILGTVAYYPPGTTIPPLPPGWASVRTLAVAPAARGRGVGAALVRECIARAREDGAPVLGLYTTDLMGAAVALYERLGFVRAEELPPRHGQRCWCFRIDFGGSADGAAG
jgi:ribosomal protein S18 acetylase RimI-like enzyme